MSKLEEIINALGIGMSDDLESKKLSEAIIKELCPEIISYPDFCKGLGYAYLNVINKVYHYYDYYYCFHLYIIYIRNQYFPRLIYSPWTKTFKGYVGS